MPSLPHKLDLAQRALRRSLREIFFFPRGDDQIIAGFPRSGKTWLRTMLVNVIDPTAESNPDVFNKVIPGISIKNATHIQKMPSPRLLTTHAGWSSKFERAVYIMRDGRDSLISYYHYQTTRLGVHLPFALFYDRYVKGLYGPTWEDNIQSWLVAGQQRLGSALYIVRYEDLKRDTPAQLQAICAFLALDTTPERIEAAILQASFSNMRKIEAQRRGTEVATNASFYRGGAEGQWKDLMTPAIEADFLLRTERMLRLGGYSV